MLRILAAALAETGRFEDAIETAERALQLAEMIDRAPLASTLRDDLDLYRQRASLRDFNLINPQPAE